MHIWIYMCPYVYLYIFIYTYTCMYIYLYHMVSSVLPTCVLWLCLQVKHITTSALASAMEDPATPVLLLDARMKEEVLFTATH